MSDLRLAPKPGPEFAQASLLPSNRTRIEEALEKAVRAAEPDLTPLATLMNPATCPVELLGWLAWSFSVDLWHEDWPEDMKRDVIGQAVKIHRVKGTVGAVRRALGAIGFRSDFSEWFEHGGDPHTFRVDAFGDDVFGAGFQISSKLVELATQLIENVKPVRSHFTLRIGEKKGGTVTLKAGSLQRVDDRRRITPALPVDTHAPKLVARTGHRAQAVSRAIHRFQMGDAA